MSAELSFEMRPQPGCNDCGGTGQLRRSEERTGHGRTTWRYCPCRQPTAVLTVRGTAEAREGLSRLRRASVYCDHSRHSDGHSWLRKMCCSDEWHHEITRRLIRWTGEEPLDLMALAEEQTPEFYRTGPFAKLAESEAKRRQLSIPGVDGLIVEPVVKMTPYREGEEEYIMTGMVYEVIEQAERLGLEVEYAE